MTSNYRRGADFERRVLSRLAQSGWTYAARTAGSHGVSDILALKATYTLYGHFPAPPRIAFLQVKRDGECGPAERASLRSLARLHAAEGYVVMLAGPGSIMARAVDRWIDGWEQFSEVF